MLWCVFIDVCSLIGAFILGCIVGAVLDVVIDWLLGKVTVESDDYSNG